ncbi:GNAT family N-acetyltransferase [Thermoactinospora rubra]|uniref:GNAT family N-acetyltransferase n=1 Tax=Thermoactinospora rubra TaxID=1088767 RepID=UPI000A11F800|nr:GNAT family N-acetyltransferase [Thermoactinospora rubra]
MIELSGAGPAEFADRLDEVIDIYAAAMRPPVEQLPGRKAIMRGHAAYPAFRCLFAELYGRAVGFAYGFHGAPGQWWHDVVHRALADKAGGQVADAWLGDAFELAEIHVLPDYQGKGIGRTLLVELCRERRERSVVLSTHDQPTVARHLYRSMGFIDLLTQFVFPGGRELYAIAGAPLPLREPREP